MDNSVLNSSREYPDQFSSFYDQSTSYSPTNAASSPRGGHGGRADLGTPTDSFSKEISRAQEEHVYYLKKLEKERRRKNLFDGEFDETLRGLRAVQDKTKNGSVLQENDRSHRKELNKLEHQMQMANVKLSVARNENTALKTKVIGLRREKFLHLQISHDLQQEASEARKSLKLSQKEIISTNEKKHKVKLGISALKNKMLKEMEDFSKELAQAKQSIGQAQASMITTMRDQLIAVTAPSTRRLNEASSRGVNSDATDNDRYEYVATNQAEIAECLKDANFRSVEELMTALEKSEEQLFVLFNDTQVEEERMEALAAENKHLEQEVEIQLSRLHKLESESDEVKLELERNIQALRLQIDKYDVDYSKNLETLTMVSANLMTLLRNISIDGEALDQQLLSTGVTDRNVDEFLGLIEQRIDELIQMSKAASKEAIKRDDFIRLKPPDKNAVFHVPALPSLSENTEDDEDDPEEQVRLQPVNIQVLKEMMQKKLQKATLNNRVQQNRVFSIFNDASEHTSKRTSFSSAKSSH